MINRAIIQISVALVLAINPFPNTLFWDCPKFKATPDVILNVLLKDFKIQIA